MAQQDAYGNYTPIVDLTGEESVPATGGGPTGASGTATDPNSAGLADSVLFYNQFDSGGNFIRQWERNPAGTFV